MTPMPGGSEPLRPTICDPSSPAATSVVPTSGAFGLTGWLVIASAVAVEQCGLLLPEQPAWWALAGACLWVAAAVALRQLTQLLASRLPAGGGWVSWSLRGLAAIAIIAAAMGVTSLTAAGGGSPEQLLMAFFRGALLGLVAASSATREMLLAVTITVFLVTFSAVVVEHPAAWVAETCYAISAAALLVSSSRCGPRRVAQPLRHRRTLVLPRPTQLAACLAVVLVVAWLGRSTDRTGRAIAGFMPFSGGDSWAFPWAQDGVGDGEQLVAATEHPQATGPVDSHLFLTSDEPSLYDLFNDLYGEPEPPRRRFSPAVALPSQSVTEPETRPAESNHAGRQFSTIRKPPRRPASLRDLQARSLVAVTGPLPVHVRLEVFHEFDGHAWHAEPSSPSAAASRLLHTGDAWMQWQPPRTGDREAVEPVHAGSSAGLRPDQHEITIGTLRSETLPLPARTTRLRIDRVEEPSFYEIVDHEVAALRGVPVPASTTIGCESLGGGLDGTAASLPEQLWPQPAAERTPRPTLPTQGDGASTGWQRSLLSGWGFDVGSSANAHRWDDAQRVVARLRQDYAVDPEAVPPAVCDDSLEHFLTVSKRGPDHLFAGAATLLLRELGYTTRLAGGLWLSAADRDPLTRRAVAQTGNAHLWCEVLTTSGQWIPVEASPQHHLRRPPWTWRQLWRLAVEAAAAVAGWLLQPVVSGLLLGMVLVAWSWRVLTERLLTALWWVALQRPGRCPLRPTWRLLEWRAWLAGCPRPPHVTARRWYVAACDDARGFITALEEQAYAAPAACRDPVEHRRLAQAAEAAVSRRALQAGHTRARATKCWLPLAMALRGSVRKGVLR